MSDSKVTQAQMAKYLAAAADSFTDFGIIEPERATPLVEVTEADLAFVRKAYTATEGQNGKWLLLQVPGTIPIDIAQQILADRIDVLREASKQAGYQLRADSNSEKSPSSHARRFRVIPATIRGKAGTPVPTA